MVAERELLQSTANTQMKGNVLETTLITHPVLKAVHSGAGSTAKERQVLRHSIFPCGSTH